MNNLYKQKLTQQIVAVFHFDEKQIQSLITAVPKEQQGDFALPCFFLAKELKKSPVQIAEELALKWKPIVDFPKVVAIKGYLNFFLDTTLFFQKVLTEILQKKKNYGKGLEGENKKVVLDFSSPNMGKELAFHHLRGTMLGHALSCLFQSSGFQVCRINHLGDWGTSYGKLIVMYLTQKEKGQAKAIEDLTIEDLNQLYTQFAIESEKHSELEDEARKVFQELENENHDYLKLWKEFKEITLKELKNIYQILGVDFDDYRGEAFFVPQTKALVQELSKSNLLTQSQGALVVNLDKYEMPPLLVQKTDGSTLYATRDLCAAKYRFETQKFDQCFYVVDSGQSLHFKQFFQVLRLMGQKWVDSCHHVPFGLILNQTKEGKWEKGKTRTGHSSLLKDVIQKAKNKIVEVINQKNPKLENKENIAVKIGIAALIFNDLKHKKSHDIKFEWDKALSFEGDSGPYVINAFVRAKSILRKYHASLDSESQKNEKWLEVFNQMNITPKCFEEPQAQELIFVLAEVSDKREKSLQAHEPCILAQYTLVLADAIHAFVHHCRILGSEKQEQRILLIYCAQTVLKNALNWIGIKPVEQM